MTDKSESGDRIGRILLFAAGITLAGICGALGAAPFAQLADGARASIAMIRDSSVDRPLILAEITRPGSGLVTNDAAAAQPGLTLVQGILPGGNQVRLLAQDGSELHRWKADFFAIWPDAEEVFDDDPIPRSQHHYFIQGMSPLPDGSIVVSFGQLGSAKLDKCSNTVWRTDKQTHHSITANDDGTFWIPGVISEFDTPQELFPNGMGAQDIRRMTGDNLSKDYNNSAILFSADGEALHEISLLKSVYDAGLENALYTSLQEVPQDPIHLNDIEIVNAALAAKIDGVDAGDLLVSLREMNMLAIVDEVTGTLKWQKQGPWVRQHDLDVTEEGTIELFNNRSTAIGAHVDTSQIVTYDPATDKMDVLFPVGDDDKFYSWIMGAQQKLENGNRLITESTAGRVFEVTPTGRIVWDYRLPYDEEMATLISYAMRVPDNFYDVGNWSCP